MLFATTVHVILEETREKLRLSVRNRLNFTTSRLKLSLSKTKTNFRLTVLLEQKLRSKILILLAISYFQ